MTAAVVGLLALRSTEFIELKRLARALLRDREFRPLFLVHRGSPVFSAHQAQFESGDVPAVFINMYYSDHRVRESKSWRLARWVSRQHFAFVDETVAHYLSQADQIKESEKILNERNVSVLVVGEDGVGADLATVAACRRLGRPVMVLPYEYSTVDQPLHYIRSDRQVFEACAIRSLPRRLLSALKPQWAIESDGERFFREPVARILANEWLGIAPILPWAVHGGNADVIATESEFLANTYVAEGIPPKKIVTTGSFALDKLRQSLDRRKEIRDRLGQTYGIDPVKPVLLCAFPPDYFLGRTDLEFKSYLEMIRFWVSSVRAVTSNVVFQCHPGVSEQERLKITEMTGILASDDIVELVTSSDLLVTSVSSIIRFAIAAGHPVANFDVYRFRYRDYKDIRNVMHAELASDFVTALQRGWTMCQNQSRDHGLHGEGNPEWGKLDGLGGQRVVALIRQLVGNGRRNWS